MSISLKKRHFEQLIRPSLASGIWVICDRFTDSTYAYQGAGRGLSLALIGQLESAVQDSLRPDLTIFLDVSPTVARQRMQDRTLDRLEREDAAFFARVREGFLQRAQARDNFVVIDADRSLESVQSDVQDAVRVLLD